MKKISINNLDDLKRKGWHVPKKDAEKIASTKPLLALNKSLLNMTEFTGVITEIAMEIQKKNIEDNNRLEILIVNLLKALSQIIDGNKPAPLIKESNKQWDIQVVERDSKGFAKNVRITQL